MKTKNPKWESDLKVLAKWFEQNCYGFRNAQKRADILPQLLVLDDLEHIGLRERYFRKLLSELNHRSISLSTARLGSYFVPLQCGNDPEEIQMFLSCVNEREKKAVSMYKNCHSQRRMILDRHKIVTNEQPLLKF